MAPPPRGTIINRVRGARSRSPSTPPAPKTMRIPLASDSRPDEPTYVSARHSRRAGGPCLDVDLTPQGGCNWACVYCDTVASDSEAPDIDLERLRSELAYALERASQPDFADGQGLRALLISGSGEPTHCFDLAPAMEAIAGVLGAAGDAGSLRIALATNGERISERRSRAALATLAELGGEVWYKLDTATRDGLKGLNRASTILRHVRNNLKVAAEAVPTWLATSVFEYGGAPSLDEAGRRDYHGLVASQLAAKVPLAGIQLYAPHRPVEGITAPDRAWVEDFAEQLRALLPVELHL
jgi:hypothetical protein